MDLTLFVQALALAFTFGTSQPQLQWMLSTLLSLLFLSVHSAASPMADPRTQSLQSVLMFCLVVVAVSGSHTAYSRGATTSSLSDTPTSTGTGRLLGQVFGVVVPALALAWAHRAVIARVLAPCTRRWKQPVRDV